MTTRLPARSPTHSTVGVPATTVWTAPDAPRDQDQTLVAAAPDLAGWCAATGTEDRLGLHGRVLTQALLGEPVEVVEEQGGWGRVVLPWQTSSADPRGYPGWVPLAHLAEPMTGTDAVAVVRPRISTLRVRGGGLELSCGTVLPLAGRDGSEVVVALPDGDRGWLDAADVAVRAGPFTTAAPEPARVVQTARQFLGTRYLWGGTSGWGADCSGLVHLAHRMHGVAAPRDAFDQHEAAEPVLLDDVRPGDLLFFARPGARAHHVGWATTGWAPGPLTMLHAPEESVLVEEEVLAERRRSHLVGAGRCR